MKNLFEIVIPIFLFSFLFSEKQIKTKTLYKYEIQQKFGENTEILNLKSISKYDSNNNVIESSSYDSDGKLFFKFISKYDSNNNEIESLTYKSENKFGSVKEILLEKEVREYEYYD